jgi:phosphoglycolate phosphatase
MKDFSLVIFDLDGTLVDSAPDLTHAVNVLLTDQGAAPLSISEVRGMIGDGAAQLVARAFTARSRRLDDPAATLSRFFEVYERDPTANTVLYEGVRETLQRLQGLGKALAVCTNKPSRSANEILRRLDVAKFFSQVVAGDTHAFRKPDPRMLTLLIAGYGVSSAEALMVGDSEVDAATAEAAQVPFALMTYGYRRGPVADIRCLTAVDRFSDLWLVRA